MAYYEITTIGALSNLADLGLKAFTSAVTSYDLIALHGITEEEIINSTDLPNAITNLELSINTDIVNINEVALQTQANTNSGQITLINLDIASVQSSISTTNTNVSNLQSQVNGISLASLGGIPLSQKGVANGVCPLGVDQKIPSIHIPAIAIPSMHVVADDTARLALTVQEGDECKQLSDTTHWIYDGTTWHQYPKPSAYGEGFARVNDYAVTTTTSTAWSTKSTLNVPMVANATYRFGWFYMWNHDSIANDFEGRIIVNGATYINHKQEPKDYGGNYGNTGTSQKYGFSGFDYFTTTIAETTIIQTQYRTDANGVKSSIWESRLEAWRVS